MHARRLTTTDRIVAVVSPDSDHAVDSVRTWGADNDIAVTTVPVGETPPASADQQETTLGVSVGGDGTLLQAVRQFAPRDVPVLGIDTGTLAFLVRVPVDKVGAALTEATRGRARIERRSRLSVAAPELSVTALNDIVVRAPPPADPVDRKTVGIDVFVGTERVGTYHGDGVVVSTATGSTGLSLSAGGPVHDPRRSEAIQIVPLATHSLGVRPLVVGPETPITVVPNRPAVVVVDGGQRHYELAAEMPVRIDGTAPPAELVATSVDDSFYHTLGDQLGWHVRDSGPATRSRPVAGEQSVDDTAADGLSTLGTADRGTALDVDYETPVDLGRALRVAVDAVESVAGPLRRWHGDVESEHHKTDSADIVTEVDRFAEETITAILDAEFPECACLSEERGSTDEDGVATWVVDPLDGTSNYANGNPNYCVSVGLLVDGEPTLGVVHAPETGKLWTGVRGAFARLDGRPVTTTTRSTLEESVLMSGYDPDGAFLRALYDDTRGVRRLGSAGLHLCYLASGAADATWEHDTAPWDVAAGLVIARAAGATVTDPDGDRFEFGDWQRRTPLLGTNGPLHDRLVGRVE